MKIFDAHVHCFNAPSNIKILCETADKMGFDIINILSAPPYGGISQNIQALFCKAYNPSRIYCFGGLEYETGRDFLEQAKILTNCGVDGFKSIEGKPTIRKKLNIALDDPLYDPFYSFLEEQGLPILMHIADPIEFWDISKMPQWTIDAGWHYDKSFVSFLQLQNEVENLLKKHPRLKLILAHFYFLSHDIKKAEYMFETYPNIYFDITAGTEMYVNFSKNINVWREFFVKYQNRIIFGTDSTDSSDLEEIKNKYVINNMELKFLNANGEIEAWDLKIKGLGLGQDVINKILWDNANNLIKQKKLNISAVLDEIDYLIDFKKDISLLEIKNILQK